MISTSVSMVGGSGLFTAVPSQGVREELGGVLPRFSRCVVDILNRSCVAMKCMPRARENDHAKVGAHPLSGGLDGGPIARDNQHRAGNAGSTVEHGMGTASDAGPVEHHSRGHTQRGGGGERSS